MQPAGRQQALDDANMSGTHLAPAKEPILATHRDHPQCALQMVGIDRHIGVAKVGAQLRLVVGRVHQRLGQWCAVNQIKALALLVAPAEEDLGDRLGMAAAILGWQSSFLSRTCCSIWYSAPISSSAWLAAGSLSRARSK